MPRRREGRGCARCSELFASGSTFFSLMIEELRDLYAFPGTVIPPTPQVKLDSMSLQTSPILQLKTLKGSGPEKHTSASTN